MPIIRRVQVEPFSAKEMFDLVNDVERYPEFLPWCKQVRILTKTDHAMDVSMEVAKGPLNKWFSTRNTLKDHHAIEINLINGPFKYLKGSWVFVDLTENQCEIRFELSFDFSLGPLSNLLNPVFEGMYSSMIRAFTNRARTIYRKPLS